MCIYVGGDRRWVEVGVVRECPLTSPVRGLTRRTLRTLRLRYPPPPLPPYILLHLIIVLLSFHCSYLFSPSDQILCRTLQVPSVGPYHIHVFTLRFIFNYCTISIYIISRTFYSLP